VRCLAKTSKARDCPLYVVGRQTAQLALNYGFRDVFCAHGTVQNLIELVVRRLSPDVGLLLHGSGEHVRGALVEKLHIEGFQIQRHILYRAESAQSLTDKALIALKGAQIRGALFFSPRSMQIFVKLILNAGYQSLCRSVSAICLSKSIANEANRLGWKEVLFSAHPETESLLDLLEQKFTIS
jgi:uroporphyrinogen-III synthase